jgi:1,2-diacylglycerol 3-beta-galactosyltransferase
MTKRVLLLISDTGGGHRSAANAITAALDELPGPIVYEHRIDDVAAHCTFPLSQLGMAYSAALRFAPPLYGALYHATNGKKRFRSVIRFCEPLYRERLKDLFVSYQPDIIVSVHPLLNHAALRARADAGLTVPLITVVTDLGRVHEGWLTPEVDAIVVPAQEVYDRAREKGIPAERIRLLGHPVHPKFEDVTATKMELRTKLGLPADKTIALLMAGGEGGGKLLPTTMALAKSKLPLHMVVVTGRNAALRTKLEELAPSLPTPMTILGYSNDVPSLMRAADLLVTKAGPGTLAEASIAEVPVVVYDFVPGQERGNLDYVRTNGIGVVALTTSDVVRSTTRIVSNLERLTAMRERQVNVAPRGSSRRIAELIASMATTGKLDSPPPPRKLAASR